MRTVAGAARAACFLLLAVAFFRAFVLGVDERRPPAEAQRVSVAGPEFIEIDQQHVQQALRLFQRSEPGEGKHTRQPDGQAGRER